MRQTVGDMIRSMAVVLALVFVMVLLAWRPAPDAITVVDPGPAIARAVADGAFSVSAPTDLDEAWRATSARWERTAESGDAAVLHLGYVTPADAYAQVTQSTAGTQRYLDEQTDRGQPAGEQVVGGEPWQRYETADRRSLVSVDGASVTVVSGSADWDEIAALAGSLAPAATAG